MISDNQSNRSERFDLALRGFDRLLRNHCQKVARHYDNTALNTLYIAETLQDLESCVSNCKEWSHFCLKVREYQRYNEVDSRIAGDMESIENFLEFLESIEEKLRPEEPDREQFRSWLRAIYAMIELIYPQGKSDS